MCLSMRYIPASTIIPVPVSRHVFFLFLVSLQSTYHVKLELLVKQWRRCKRCDTGSTQREVCVDDRAVLAEVVLGDEARIEAGPEQPQEQSSC